MHMPYLVMIYIGAIIHKRNTIYEYVSLPSVAKIFVFRVIIVFAKAYISEVRIAVEPRLCFRKGLIYVGYYELIMIRNYKIIH